MDKVNLLEKLTESSIIFHQVHKRIWPSAQRDTCFLSHIRQLNKEDVEHIDKEVGSPWMVMNIPVEHDDAKVIYYLSFIPIFHNHSLYFTTLFIPPFLIFRNLIYSPFLILLANFSFYKERTLKSLTPSIP